MVVMAFFLAFEDCGKGLKIHFPLMHIFCFVFEVEISLRIPIPLFRPGSVHSCSAIRDDCG